MRTEMGSDMSNASIDDRVREIVRQIDDPATDVAGQFCDRYDPESAAFTFVDAEGVAVEYTYGDLADRSKRIAQVLHDLGVRQGDRVATLMGKSFDLPSVLLATWRLGAVYVPLFTAFAPDAVQDRLERADAKVIVTDSRQRGKVRSGSWKVLVSGSPDAPEGLDAVCGEVSPWEGVSPTGPQVPIVHIFTSGTTGKPKAVVHTKTFASGWLGYLEFGLGVTGESRFWSAADPGWGYGLYTAIIAPLACGYHSVMTTGAFDPSASWDLLERLAITDFAAAPTVLRAMRDSGAARPLPALARISTAGEPLTADVFEWTASLGAQAHDHFGQTEIGMVAGFPHNPRLTVAVQPRSMGVSFPGWTLVVLDPLSDVLVPDGTTGRLAIDVARSPFLAFDGYGVGRDVSGDRFAGDGAYYVTGDLASIEDGLFRFLSRDDDVILMAGYRIGPFEIETSLRAHPAVREAAIVAAPDAQRGEIVCAFIVLEADVNGSDELSSELQRWVKTNYAAHAYPRRIIFVESMPKTESGKIKRALLRRSLA